MDSGLGAANIEVVTCNLSLSDLVQHEDTWVGSQDSSAQPLVGMSPDHYILLDLESDVPGDFARFSPWPQPHQVCSQLWQGASLPLVVSTLLQDQSMSGSHGCISVLSIWGTWASSWMVSSIIMKQKIWKEVNMDVSCLLHREPVPTTKVGKVVHNQDTICRSKKR